MYLKTLYLSLRRTALRQTSALTRAVPKLVVQIPAHFLPIQMAPRPCPCRVEPRPRPSTGHSRCCFCKCFFFSSPDLNCISRLEHQALIISTKPTYRGTCLSQHCLCKTASPCQSIYTTPLLIRQPLTREAAQKITVPNLDTIKL